MLPVQAVTDLPSLKMIHLGKASFFERVASYDIRRVDRWNAVSAMKRLDWRQEGICDGAWFAGALAYIRELMAECHPDRCRAWYASKAFRVLVAIKTRLVTIEEGRKKSASFRLRG